MPEWLIALFDNFTVLRIHSLFGFVLLGLFVVYFFSREGRDERGRKVISRKRPGWPLFLYSTESSTLVRL